MSQASASTVLNPVPRHVAIIMDGNGRWASARFLPRIAGHKRGINSVRTSVEYALEHNIDYLTLFAFSSENWRRPPAEVSYLLSLFENVLEQEIAEICQQHVRLNVIGDIARLSPSLQKAIARSVEKTASHDKLVLTIAVNYGGHWDITQAVSRLMAAGKKPEEVTGDLIRSYLSLGSIPDPDLFIRTGGEQRISNFLLWNLAYTELYFTDTLWPDFTKKAFAKAIDFYLHRERRFGQTSEQVSPS